MDYHGDLYLYNVCLGSNKNILLLLLRLPCESDKDASQPLIGVNISERKSGTERTKKRKKRESVIFSPPGGATDTAVHRLDATRIFPELR